MNARRRFLGQLGIAAGAAIAPSAMASPGSVLTATDVHVKDYPTVKAVEWLGRELARQTDGRLTIHQYHSGQLGRESEAIDMARFNAIDITRVYSGGLNNAFPLTRALSLPYVFDSVAHLRRAVDGGVGASVLSGFAARGLVGLAIYDCGARSFYNTRHPIFAPEDMHGLKLRVPLSDIFMRLIRAFGANPTPLAYGEVFSALETHLIDGAENNIKSFHSSRQFEAARYWSNTEHSYAPDVLVMSKRRFDALSPVDRERLLHLSAQSVGVMRRLWDETAEASLLALKAADLHINDVDLAAFRKASLPVLGEFRRDADINSLYHAIRDLS
jgi:tripartite ATP-independent transporter DctP family solute receptor